ncbi:MAG: hypothetical protein KAH25_10010 [Bacteroidales bacterium]|nr:hypothetical protein [Bacteroidales bacterium]
MKKYSILLIAFILTLSFTSCIDLVEEISVNKNKSGHYNLGVQADGLAGLISLNSQQFEVPAIKELDEKISILKQQAGISNVKKDFKANSFFFNLSFDFEDEKSLNNAMYTLAEVEPSIFIKKFLKIKNHKIIRPNLNTYLQILIQQQGLLDDLPSKDVLNYINYKLVINTPSEIKRINGKNAVVMANKTTAISSFSFKDLVMNNPNISLKVKY